MKILCDVCGANEADVLCCADEAALCSDCDRRVHRANKLAGKHPRLSLLSSSPQPHPLCDICKERRALVFCKEDRAILCYECDFSIHSANDFTMKHGRFILTGTRLSSAFTTTSSPSSEQSTTKKKVSEPVSPLMADCSSSSISEYLIKMLPGYHFEDFLLDDSIDHGSGDVFQQSDALAPLVKGDLDVGVASAADWNFSVPHAPLHLRQTTAIVTATATATATGVANDVRESSNRETSRAHHFLAPPAAAIAASHCEEQWTTEEVFAVPELPSVPGSNKRPCRRYSAWNF